MTADNFFPQKIYKYISYFGLAKTLQSQTFQLSKPTELNDPLDMALQETLGQELEDFLPGLNEAFLNLITSEVDLTGLKNGPNKEKILIMQKACKNASPEQRRAFLKEASAFSVNDVYDLDKLRERNKETTTFISNTFQSDGVFCSTVNKENLLMWAHYADKHNGAVIEFAPSVAKKSALLASEPVVYSEIRPLLFKTPRDLLKHALFMSMPESAKILVHNLVYTKSLEWAYEKEYRLYVPMIISAGEKFGYIKFHSEELSAIYLGCRMMKEHKETISSLAKIVNHNVELFETKVTARAYGLTFQRI